MTGIEALAPTAADEHSGGSRRQEAKRMTARYPRALRLLTSTVALATVIHPTSWNQEAHAQDNKQVERSDAQNGTRHLPLITDFGDRNNKNKIAILAQQANRLQDAGDYPAAIALWEQILAWSEAQLGPEHLDTATSLNNLASLYSEQGNYSSAEPLFTRALAIREKALGAYHPDTATSLQNLGYLYLEQGNYSKAESLDVRALAIREKALGPDHPDTANSINNLASLYSDQGAYSKAEALYIRALAIREKTLGPDHPDTANSLNNLAFLYSEQGNYSSAEPLFTRALAIREKALGPNHPDTANSLHNLAFLYNEQGNYRKAEPLYIRALAINKKALGPEHPYTANVLSNLALLYINQGNYSKAEPLYISALAIREKTFGPDHPQTATSLSSLALLYAKQGSYGKAMPLYVRALAIDAKALGADHPYTATNLNNLATLYRFQGAYSKAEPLYARALAIREKALGPDHPDTANSLNSLAGLYSDQGAYSKAEPLYIRALAIREKALGPNHPDTATSLHNLGHLYNEQGNYSKVEPLYSRALAIHEKALGPDHPDTANSLDSLAGLYSDQGAYSKAEPLYARALAIREKALGPDHPDTANSLNSLAGLYSDQGAYSKAKSLYNRALAIREKTLGPDHPDTAIILTNLAALHSEQGFHRKAEPLYIRALAIREKALGPDHLSTANSLNNLGALYYYQGIYSKAEELYARALGIIDKTLGPQHAITAITLKNIAELYINQGAYHKAEPYLRRAISAELSVIQREVPHIALYDRQAFLTAHSDSYSFPFAIAVHPDQISALALFFRLNHKGLLADIEQRQSSFARLPGPQKEVAKELRLLNTQLSSATLSPEQRQSIRERQEELERKLYILLPQLKPLIVEAGEVAAALPSGSTLMELQKYQPYDGRKPKDQRWGKSRYLALILKPDGSISPVQLGPAAPIESAIHQALKASAENNSDAKDLWAQVSSLVLKPLIPALSGSRQWFLAPDAELNRVPFAALPSPQDPNKPLAEGVQLRLVTTGRDLLRLQQPAKTAQGNVVMANPNFDRREPSNITVASATKSDNKPQSRSAELDDRPWTLLPATEREGQQIGQLLATRPITGNDATTTRLQQLTSPRVLHIATHGFFKTDVETKPSDPLSALRDQSGMLRSSRGEDPLLRSGLVLAGANQPDADPNDDGYLTAAEAVALQLDGTELVVLSACSTGQGDIRTGEGVYGLQRSLTVAGARSTLLSLWKVDDAATAEFMSRFYKRLKAGEGRSDALAATQKEFREGLVRDPKTNALWDAPYYWAAWQLVGDWRPIKGL